MSQITRSKFGSGIRGKAIGYNFFGPQSLVQLGYAYNETGGAPNHQIGLQVNLPINMLQYFPIGD